MQPGLGLTPTLCLALPRASSQGCSSCPSPRTLHLHSSTSGNRDTGQGPSLPCWGPGLAKGPCSQHVLQLSGAWHLSN